ncbi:MAG TPA: DNA-processing protein DprA [Caulobacteraceae bacterium]
MTSQGDSSRDSQIAWLRLARSEGVGPATFAHLLSRFGSAEAALDALPDLARRGGRSAHPRIASPAEAERELERGQSAGARLLLSADEGFPAALKATDGAPPLLWVLGDPNLLLRPCLAIVGARVASAAGRRFARELAVGLGQAGFVVVSGLARGIDAAAHAGSVETGTVAVLAGGVDRPYPPENQDLYRQLALGGCVVSEQPMGHEARASDFPRRNRIISGLSLGVIVVEAELRSGSLITARLAGEQGREVFAVPGSPLEPRSRGTNNLIRHGATLVEGVEDVLEALEAPGVASVRLKSPPQTVPIAESPDDLSETLEALLSATPVSADDLARASGAPVSAVTAALVELSLAGRAELVGGGLAVRV